MKARHWDSLVTSVRHGQCILVLGPEIPAAGASEAGDPAAESLSYAEALASHLSVELEAESRTVVEKGLPAVAQYYEDSPGFGPHVLRGTSEKFYKSAGYEASSAHQIVASLPFGLIITTCHDNLLARALARAGKRPIVERYHFRGSKQDNAEFMLPGSPETPVLYHLFGSACEPATMVLSENDLLDFFMSIVSQRPPLPNSLLGALKQNGQSFLFVGFGVRYWHLRILLKVLVRSLELYRNGSAIATESLRGLTDADRQQTILFYERGTRIEFEDRDINSFLLELQRRLSAEGGFVGKPSPLGSRPRVFISYAREDEALAGRLFDVLKNAHFDPWIDKQSLMPGTDWDQTIRTELETTDYVLVLCTPALTRKIDSYINREIALSVERAQRLRGPFSYLVPLMTYEVPDAERIPELRRYNEMWLDPANFDADAAKLISTLTRDFQRRNR